MKKWIELYKSIPKSRRSQIASRVEGMLARINGEPQSFEHDVHWRNGWADADIDLLGEQIIAGEKGQKKETQDA